MVAKAKVSLFRRIGDPGTSKTWPIEKAATSLSARAPARWATTAPTAGTRMSRTTI